jgi:hypothetical protein
MNSTDWSSDRIAWGLTHDEYVHYLHRMHEYHAWRLVRLLDKSERFERISFWVLLWIIAVGVVSIIRALAS